MGRSGAEPTALSGGNGRERVLLDTSVGWGLAGARRALRRAAIVGGLAPDRADDLLIAANEVLTNALIHGGGGAKLRVSAAGGWVTCEIGDGGGGFEGASEGRNAPDLRHAPQGGMGLWIVRRLCDEVLIRTGQGATVTLRMKVAT